MCVCKAMRNVFCFRKREREERPPLLPVSGAAAAGVGHHVAQRPHYTAELAAGSVRVLLLRLLLPAAHRRGTERRLAAAAPRAGRRDRRHRRGLAADQWRHTTVPAGKPRPPAASSSRASLTHKPAARDARIPQTTTRLLESERGAARSTFSSRNKEGINELVQTSLLE